MFVVHPCETPVELGERDELLLGKVCVRHVAAVELVHACRELRAAAQGEAQSIARTPGIRTESQPPAGPDVLVDEARVTLETTGGEDRRLTHAPAEAQVAGRADEHVGETAGIESLADRPRVPGLVRHDGCAQRLEPRDAVVQLLPDGALQALVAGGTFRAEVVPLAKAPDHAARQEHRAARARPLLVDDGRGTELARTRRCAQTGHARAGDDECPYRQCWSVSGRAICSRARASTSITGRNTRSVRIPACARRTRCARARGPRRRRPVCSRRRPRSRGRPCPLPRQCARRPSRQGPQGG